MTNFDDLYIPTEEEMAAQKRAALVHGQQRFSSLNADVQAELIGYSHAEALEINRKMPAVSGAVVLVKELIASFTFPDGIAFGKKWAWENYQDIAFRLFNAGHKAECEALYYAWEETEDNGDQFVARLNAIIA